MLWEGTWNPPWESINTEGWVLLIPGATEKAIQEQEVLASENKNGLFPGIFHSDHFLAPSSISSYTYIFIVKSLSLCLFSSVQSLSRVWLFATPWTAAHQVSLSIINSKACLNSCPSSRGCHPTISSSVVPFSSCLQSFPASGSFPMSPFFTSGGQSIGASGSASVLPMIIQDWFPLGWTGWIPFQSKELSRVFSNTTVQKHWFFGAQLCSKLYFWTLLGHFHYKL